MRAALRCASTLEDVRELADGPGGEIDHLGLARTNGSAAAPVQLDLAFGSFGRTCDRLLSNRVPHWLGLWQHLELQRRREPAGLGHGLQRLGKVRVATGAQRDVHIAAVAATHHSAHEPAHAAHARRGVGRDVDPALRNRWLVGWALPLLGGGSDRGQDGTRDQDGAWNRVQACLPWNPLAEFLPWGLRATGAGSRFSHDRLDSPCEPPQNPRSRQAGIILAPEVGLGGEVAQTVRARDS